MPYLNRRGVIERLNELVEDGDERVVVHVFQKRPNTFAATRFHAYTGVGFSKVCYPDTWDEDKGIEIARNKAIQDIGNQLWKNEDALNILR